MTTSLKPEGPAEFRDGVWKARVWIPTGETGKDGKPLRKRTWLALKGIPEHDRQAARVASAMLQCKIDERGYVPAERDLTVAEFYARWSEVRKVKVSSWTNDESYWTHHIREILGHVPLRAVTSERLTDFVGHLDRKVEKGKISASHATNIWCTVRAMFRDACKSKDRSLRLLDVNPALTVPPPDKDANGEKAKQMLYPDELLRLVSCGEIPLARRRLWAFLVLTATRPSEARAIEWTDIDSAHRVVRINKQDDQTTRDRGVVATKGRKTRDTTLEETMVPMLEAMKAEAKGKGRVFPTMPAATGDYGVCAWFRRDLLTAGVDRHELHHPTKTSMAIRAHDLRASGITWRLARGDNPMVVRQETGHADAEVQQLYVRRLRDLGDLFPALPAELAGASEEALRKSWPGTGPVARRSLKNVGKLVGATGFEPVTSTV